MPIYGKAYPEVLIEATNTEDIAKIVKLCYDNNVVVIPRGAGTGLTGTAVAMHGGRFGCRTNYSCGEPFSRKILWSNSHVPPIRYTDVIPRNK